MKQIMIQGIIICVSLTLGLFEDKNLKIRENSWDSQNELSLSEAVEMSPSISTEITLYYIRLE